MCRRKARVFGEACGNLAQMPLPVCLRAGGDLVDNSDVAIAIAAPASTAIATPAAAVDTSRDARAPSALCPHIESSPCGWRRNTSPTTPKMPMRA